MEDNKLKTIYKKYAQNQILFVFAVKYAYEIFNEIAK